MSLTTIDGTRIDVGETYRVAYANHLKNEVADRRLTFLGLRESRTAQHFYIPGIRYPGTDQAPPIAMLDWEERRPGEGPVQLSFRASDLLNFAAAE